MAIGTRACPLDEVHCPWKERRFVFQGKTVLAESLLEGDEVRRFILGEDADEIENDRAKDGPGHGGSSGQALYQ
ncbi:MAG: hypothetical protein ACREJU_18205 [Nitrospiraceae bacterium]